MNKEIGNKITRCPRLGQEIAFSYCFQESPDLPCSRIVQCWSSVFDVTDLLQKELTEEKWRRFSETEPKDKLVSIIELIEAAKKIK